MARVGPAGGRHAAAEEGQQDQALSGREGAARTLATAVGHTRSIHRPGGGDRLAWWLARHRETEGTTRMQPQRSLPQ